MKSFTELSSATQAAVGQALSLLCPDWLPSAVTALEYLSGGYSNTNFKLRYEGADYVLRLPGVAQPFVDRAHEKHWYSLLSSGLSARLVALDEASGAMLTEWVEGQMVAEIQSPPDCSTLLDYVRRLHAQLPHTERRYRVEEIYPEVARATIQRPDLTNVPLVTCHNDLNPWNVLIDPAGAWITLDWEFVGLNDPLFDLVCLHQGLERDPAELPQLCAELLNCSEADLGERVQANVSAYWQRELGWAEFQNAQGNRRVEIRNQAEQARARLRELQAESQGSS